MKSFINNLTDKCADKSEENRNNNERAIFASDGSGCHILSCMKGPSKL